MSTIAEIEDALISTLNATSLFREVRSVGRQTIPDDISTPFALVYFEGEARGPVDEGVTYECDYKLVIAAKNFTGEAVVSRSVYDLVNSVYGAIEGSSMGLTDIIPFVVSSCKLLSYELGRMEYEISVHTTRLLQ